MIMRIFSVALPLIVPLVVRVAKCAVKMLRIAGGMPMRSSTAIMASGCTMSYAFFRSTKSTYALRPARHSCLTVSLSVHTCH